MVTFIKSLTFDCHDVLAVAHFWAAALRSNVDEEATAEKAYVEAAGWGGPNLWFVKVPEPKVAKNRLHFDLRTPSGIDQEVQRLQELAGLPAPTNPTDEGATIGSARDRSL